MNPTLKTSLMTGLVLGMTLPGAVFARSWNDPKNPRKITINDPRGFDTSFRGDPGWHPTHYTYKLFEMDLEGSVANQNLPWGDTYWPSQRAGMAYRWKEFQRDDMDQTLSLEDRKRLFFDIKRYPRSELLALKRSDPAKYKSVIATLAPLEKYALYISRPGDEDYYNSPILSEFTKSKQAQREYWEGYCHAWASVATHYGEPVPVTKTTSDGLEIPFFSGDVKALLVANYQQKTSATFGGVVSRFFDKDKRAQVRFVGKRCGTRFMYPVLKKKKGVEMFADYGETEGLTEEQYLTQYLPDYQAKAKRKNFSLEGDNIEQASDFVQKVKTAMDSCENTNAGSFHIVIANQLGKMKEGFMFDKTRDVEVWNQPAFKYASQIEKMPVSSLPTSAPGTTSVVKVKTKLYYADDSDYGWTYSTPANLGLFNWDGNATFQGMIESFKQEYAKYSRLLMNEGDEDEPLKYPLGLHDAANYEYTLDINASGEIIGGDWISFNRPDYMWIMKKEGFVDDFKRLGEVYQAVQYPAGQTPNFGPL
jgi:hypothetical protein